MLAGRNQKKIHQGTSKIILKSIFIEIQQQDINRVKIYIWHQNNIQIQIPEKERIQHLKINKNLKLQNSSKTPTTKGKIMSNENCCKRNKI